MMILAELARGLLLGHHMTDHIRRTTWHSEAGRPQPGLSHDPPSEESGELTHAQIAARAYEKWLARGAPAENRGAIDDWITAIDELRHEMIEH
jgi:hypothetical protein